MICLTKLFQQKRRRIGYILAFSAPTISKRDSSEIINIMFLGGIFWGLIGGDEDWTTKVFLALIIICGILLFGLIKLGWNKLMDKLFG